MGAILTALQWISTFLVGAKASGIATKVAEFAAYRALYIVLIMTVLPYSLYTFGSYLFSKFSSYFDAYTLSLSPVVIDASGMLAWLLDCFMVPQSLSVILSAFVARYSIRILRFMVFWR